MKTIITLILVSTNLMVFGQWQILNSGTTEELRSVFFTSVDTGTVVGKNGTILRTEDGGENWVKVSSGTDKYLYSVEFTSNQIGYIVGDNGLILKTIDGGTNWSDISVGNLKFFDSYFISNDTGYIVGNGGALYKTTDGGQNWINLSLQYNGLFSVFFNSVDTGFVVGWGEAKTILNTTDGGSSWSNQDSNSNAFYQSIAFTNADTGYICTSGPSGGSILKTKNGGNSWSIIYNGYLHGGLYAIKFPSSNVGYAVGGFPDNTVILSTNDAGAHWTKVNITNQKYLFDCYFLNEETGYAVGTGGIIMKKLNEGVGIKDLVFDHSVRLYPNPTSGLLNIELDESIKFSAIITLTNLSGQVIVKESRWEKWKLDITEVPSGVYLLKVESDNNTSAKLVFKL